MKPTEVYHQQSARHVKAHRGRGRLSRSVSARPGCAQARSRGHQPRPVGSLQLLLLESLHPACAQHCVSACRTESATHKPVHYKGIGICACTAMQGAQTLCLQGLCAPNPSEARTGMMMPSVTETQAGPRCRSGPHPVGFGLRLLLTLQLLLALVELLLAHHCLLLPQRVPHILQHLCKPYTSWTRP